MAEHTFTDFFLAILTGLLLILPGPYLGFGAIVLLALALGSLLRLVPEFLRMSFSAESTAAEHRGYAFKRLSISLLGRLFLAAAAVALLLPAARFMSMDSAFLTATVVLLVNAVRNAWFLLVHELPGH